MMKCNWRGIFRYGVELFLILFFALLLKVFAVDFFVVPTDSMSPTIESGDFILVDKISFGARMYQNFDFMRDSIEPEVRRMKGFTDIHHNDVLVFNFPYIDIWDKIRMNLSRFYVKRCIGLPGDTLAVCSGYYEVNGRRGYGNQEQQRVIAEHKGDFPKAIYRTFPFDKRLGWNILNMGPLFIPARGSVVKLDSFHVRLYAKMIVYESRDSLHIYQGQVYRGDTLQRNYTFRTNWYFLGGDHAWSSQDSRYIGLIPEEFIIGKARLVLTAKDPKTDEYRWSRFLTRIK